MKMTIHGIDEEIRHLENRIAIERVALQDAVDGCKRSMTEVATSPKALLGVLAASFAAGKLIFRKKPEPRRREPEEAPVKKAGAFGLITGIAGTALSMAGSRFGWGSVASWAMRRYLDQRRARVRGAGRAATPAGVSARPPVAGRTAPPMPPRTPTGT